MKKYFLLLIGIVIFPNIICCMDKKRDSQDELLGMKKSFNARENAPPDYFTRMDRQRKRQRKSRKKRDKLEKLADLINLVSRVKKNSRKYEVVEVPVDPQAARRDVYCVGSIRQKVETRFKLQEKKDEKE